MGSQSNGRFHLFQREVPSWRFCGCTRRRPKQDAFPSLSERSAFLTISRRCCPFRPRKGAFPSLSERSAFLTTYEVRTFKATRKRVSISFREKCLPDTVFAVEFSQAAITMFPSLSERSAFLTNRKSFRSNEKNLKFPSLSERSAFLTWDYESKFK